MGTSFQVFPSSLYISAAFWRKSFIPSTTGAGSVFGVSIIASTQPQTPRQTAHLITQGTAVPCLSHTPSSTLLYFHISSLQKPARTAVGPRPVSELDVNAEGWREGREQMPLPPAVLVLSSLRLPVMSDRSLKNAARDMLSLEYQQLGQY